MSRSPVGFRLPDSISPIGLAGSLRKKTPEMKATSRLRLGRRGKQNSSFTSEQKNAVQKHFEEQGDSPEVPFLLFGCFSTPFSGKAPSSSSSYNPLLLSSDRDDAFAPRTPMVSAQEGALENKK